MTLTDVMRENFWSALCSISDYSEESIAKLNTTFTVPPTLCRFRSVNTNTLWQLQENTQFFSTADHYDDPFDTYFKIDFRRLKDTYELIEKCLANENAIAIRDILLKFGFDPGEIDRAIQDLKHQPLSLPQVNQSLIDVRDMIQRSIWSICFCENPLNETTWMKYADHHKGFALTYDFNDGDTYLCGKEEKCRQCGISNMPPVIYPVYYGEKEYDATWYALGLIVLANANAKKFDLPDSIKYFIDLSGRWQWQRISLIKKKCHHYDEEWRMLSLVPYNGKPQIKLKPNSVIIGLRTPPNERDLIISAAKTAGIENISKMYISADNTLCMAQINE